MFYSRLDVSARRAERRSDTYLGHTYKVLKYLEENYSQNITSKELSDATGLSADYISKQFKRELSMTPSFILNIRKKVLETDVGEARVRILDNI